MIETKTLRCAVFICLLLCTLIVLAGCGTARDESTFPEMPQEGSVYDETGTLHSQTRQHIIEKSEELFALTGTRITVACVRDTGALSISEYARQLFLEWEIGASGKETGILLLLCPRQEGYWCLQSRTLESDLSDKQLGLILRQYFEPHFLSGDCDTGVQKTVDALAQALIPSPPETDSSATEEPAQPQSNVVHRKSNSNVLAWAVIVVLVLLLVLHFVLVSERQPRRQKRRTVYSSPRPRRVTGSRISPLRRPIDPPKGRPRPNASYSRPTSSRPIQPRPTNPRPGPSRPTGYTDRSRRR
ncbi:MAG: TPM domain-containing protein [Clostridia bacterium]|nr:TPM domain-containing protein [Clostridia bacterium]